MAAPRDETPCRVCEGPAAAPFTLCFCCGVLVRQLQMPLVRLVTITDYRMGDFTHRRLRGYKDAPLAEVREECTARLVTMVEAWLATEGIRSFRRAEGEWDTVSTVPSSRRPVGAPVDAVVGAVSSLALQCRPLLVRGPEPTGHLQAARRGFAVRPEVGRDGVRGLSVLLVDDSVVTGARVQSAAAALRLAGARVVGAVALGRLVPARSDPRSPTVRR